MRCVDTSSRALMRNVLQLMHEAAGPSKQLSKKPAPVVAELRPGGKEHLHTVLQGAQSTTVHGSIANLFMVI